MSRDLNVINRDTQRMETFHWKGIQQVTPVRYSGAKY